ncbi:TPA: tape measure protein [Enterococcus faecium]
MESYSVEAILSAVDKNFSSTMKNADSSMNNLDNSTQKTNTSILDIAKGVGVFKLVDKGIGFVTSSVGGAIDRFDTLNKYPVVMQALGYSANQVDNSMSKLTKGIDGLPTSLNEIVSNTQQLAISTGDLDKGTDTAIALNNAFLASGASTADASRGMQQYVQMLSKGTVDMQSWRSIQETMPIAMDKVAKSFEDRGVNSVNELYDALQDGTITFDDFNNRLIKLNEGVGGFAELAKKNSAGIRTSFSNIKTAVVKGLANVTTAIDKGMQDAGLGSIAENFDNIKDAVNEVFSSIVAVLPTAIDYLTKLYNAIKPFLPVIIGITTAVVTYQIVMGTARKAVELYNTAQEIMNAVMAANPIGLLVTAIILLVGSFIYLWNTSEGFRNFWIDLWDGIKNTVDVAVEWIQNTWNSMSEWFTNLWQSIKDGADKTWNAIQEAPGKAADWIQNKWAETKEFFSNIWKNIQNAANEAWEGVKQTADSAWEGIKNIVSDVWQKIVNTISPYIEDIKNIFQPMIDFFSNLWSQISSIAGSAWEIIKTVIMGPILLLIDLIIGDFNQLKEDATMLWTTLTTNIQNIITTFVDLVVGYYTSFKDTLINIWNILSSSVKNIWNSFTTWISDTTTNIVNKIKQSWEDFKQGTIDLFNNTVQGAKDIWNSFKTWTIDLFNNTIQGAKDIWNSFKSWIINLITNTKNNIIQGWENLKQGTIDTFNNLVSGAQEVWDNLVNAVSDTVDRVTGWFDNLKNIDLLAAGKTIMDSFLEGLQNAWKSVQDFVGGIGDWIREHKGPIRYDRKLLIPAGQAIMNGLNAGLTNGFASVQSNVGNMANMIADSFTRTPDIDLSANLKNANRNFTTQIEHSVNYGKNKRPAVFNIRLGNQVFEAFVEDISNIQGKEADINLLF